MPYTKITRGYLMKRVMTMVLLLIFAASVCLSLGAEELKAAVGQVSPQGIDAFSKLFTAIAEATGNTVKIDVVPSARGMLMVATGKVDFCGPVTASRDPKQIANLDYDYSTLVTHETPLVLYTNKKKDISVEDLKKGNKSQYKIETAVSMVDIFPFKTLPSTNVEGSLKKVDSGDIDGYIYAQAASDPILKSLGLKTIKRTLFDMAKGVLAIAKGSRGGEIDLILSKGVEILKANGKYAIIMSSLAGEGSKYSDWQP
jgi:polar amino acid transport system substrate-binding protein